MEIVAGDIIASQVIFISKIISIKTMEMEVRG